MLCILTGLHVLAAPKSSSKYFFGYFQTFFLCFDFFHAFRKEITKNGLFSDTSILCDLVLTTIQIKLMLVQITYNSCFKILFGISWEIQKKSKILDESRYPILQLMENGFRHARGSVHFHHFVTCIALLTAIV